MTSLKRRTSFLYSELHLFAKLMSRTPTFNFLLCFADVHCRDFGRAHPPQPRHNAAAKRRERPFRQRRRVRRGLAVPLVRLVLQPAREVRLHRVVRPVAVAPAARRHHHQRAEERRGRRRRVTARQRTTKGVAREQRQEGGVADGSAVP